MSAVVRLSAPYTEKSAIHLGSSQGRVPLGHTLDFNQVVRHDHLRNSIEQKARHLADYSSSKSSKPKLSYEGVLKSSKKTRKGRDGGIELKAGFCVQGKLASQRRPSAKMDAVYTPLDEQKKRVVCYCAQEFSKTLLILTSVLLL